MKTENYISPDVELVDITAEGCFATSPLTNDPDDFNYEPW